MCTGDGSFVTTPKQVQLKKKNNISLHKRKKQYFIAQIDLIVALVWFLF